VKRAQASGCTFSIATKPQTSLNVTSAGTPKDAAIFKSAFTQHSTLMMAWAQTIKDDKEGNL
jgi:hypothetical protein